MNANTAMPSTVAVVCGGDSAEREISLQSGAAVVEAAREAGFDVIEVDPQRRGWIESLQAVDIALIVLHGPGGEDGAVQGALQTLGVAYSGSGVLGSALAMDKQRTKQLWQGIGLPTPGFETLGDKTDWQSVIDSLGTVFVKPACEGSSIGMNRAETAAELEAAYADARQYRGPIIAEQFVDGPEYTVAILGDVALPSIRLETDNTFYDYQAKYLSDDTRYHLPSGLSSEEEQEIADLALRAFQSLGCAVWGRVDIMRNVDGQFYLLEVNTAPGMTSHSLVPMAAKASGLSMPALTARIAELSLKEVR
ncbi:MAG: D-alanine--D-alanine ligase [Halioglobus sp.]